jgi:hypothetical protein
MNRPINACTSHNANKTSMSVATANMSVTTASAMLAHMHEHARLNVNQSPQSTCKASSSMKYSRSRGTCTATGMCLPWVSMRGAPVFTCMQPLQFGISLPACLHACINLLIYSTGMWQNMCYHAKYLSFRPVRMIIAPFVCLSV